MREKGAYDLVAEILPAAAFYLSSHQLVYSAIQDLHGKSAAVDELTVMQQLITKGELELIGGPGYLTKLTTDVVSGAHIEAHARIVLQQYMRREMINACGQIITDAYDNSMDVFDLLDSAESKVFHISQTHVHSDYFTMGETMVSIAKDVERMQQLNTDITGVPSGFSDIDSAIHGWQNTDLIIIGARPSVGKTAFALNLAKNAVDAGSPVGIFSLEMSRQQVGKRIISAHTGIPLNSIMTGKMDDRQWNHFMQTGIYQLGQSKIYIDDRAGINMFSIRSKARKMVNKHGVKLIIVDYLQLINGTGEKVREQEVSKISRELKMLAKDLGVPVIALSQLGRDADGEEPGLKNLRESGAIEQDADVVFFLWKASKKELTENPSLNSVRFWKLAKHRNGKLDEGALPFLMDIQKFEDPGPSEKLVTTKSSQFPTQSGRWTKVQSIESEAPPF